MENILIIFRFKYFQNKYFELNSFDKIIFQHCENINILKLLCEYCLRRVPSVSYVFNNYNYIILYLQ